MNMNRYQKAGQSGFGLLEVLVALLVMGVGVLGFAALQIRAANASGESYFRSQAMAIAQDLVERVQVNREQRSAGYVSSVAWAAAAPSSPPTTCNYPAAACTAAQISAYDISQVQYYAATQLPAGVVRMEACQASMATCVYVAWSGTAATAGAAGQCVDASGVYVTGANCVMLETN